MMVTVSEWQHSVKIEVKRNKRHESINKPEELMKNLGKIMADGPIELKKAAGLLASWIRYYSDDTKGAMKALETLALDDFRIDFLWAE